MAVWGDRWAGIGWLAGSLLQTYINLRQQNPTGSLFDLVLGIPKLPSQRLTASAFDVTASTVYVGWGQYDKAVRICCALGEIGTAATNWPDLAKRDPTVMAGFIVSTVVKGCGFFSPELTKKYEQSDNLIWRHTFGSPRRTSLINAASCLFFLWHGVNITLQHGPHIRVPHPEVVAPYAAWLLAYLAASLSKSQLSKTRRQPTPS